MGREDPLEEEMATHSRIRAWRLPWTEEPGGLQPRGSQKVRHSLETKKATTSIISNVNKIFFFFHLRLMTDSGCLSSLEENDFCRNVCTLGLPI